MPVLTPDKEPGKTVKIPIEQEEAIIDSNVYKEGLKDLFFDQAVRAIKKYRLGHHYRSPVDITPELDTMDSILTEYEKL